MIPHNLGRLGDRLILGCWSILLATETNGTVSYQVRRQSLLVLDGESVAFTRVSRARLRGNWEEMMWVIMSRDQGAHTEAEFDKGRTCEKQARSERFKLEEAQVHVAVAVEYFSRPLCY